MPTDDMWAGLAQFFRLDPWRELDPLLAKIASFLQDSDHLVDVGGGAGRLALPLSFRCSEVTVIDPSAGMAKMFAEAVDEAAIANCRFIEQDWLEADDVEGDVALVAHVTYFVRQIAPFVEKLHRASRRRVIIAARSTPPPNTLSPIFRLIHGVEMAPTPGPDELLAVLHERGIPAERLDCGPAAAPATMRPATTREQMITNEVENAMRHMGLKPEDKELLAKRLEEQFDELFADTERGFIRRNTVDSRDLLITWETA